MGFTYETGDDFSTGNRFLDQPGEYHMVVAEVSEKPRKGNGELIPNAAFGVKLKVLAGSVAGQEDREMDVSFFNPKSDSKDGGAMAKKKIDRMLLATNLIDPDDKGKKLEIDLNKMVNRQILVKCDEEEGTKRKFVSISFANIFHVDDPEAASYPRDVEAIRMIPTSLRRIKGQSMKAQEPKVSEAPKKDFSAI